MAPRPWFRFALRVFVPIACVRSAIPPGWGPVPKAWAIGELRSLRTSRGFGYCPNLLQLLTRRTAAAFAARRGWKRSQFRRTLLAVHTLVCLSAVPKTTASFANFQLYAHFHDGFSILLSSPDGGLCCWLLHGVKRTRPGSSDFFCPDGGLPPEFSSCLS